MAHGIGDGPKVAREEIVGRTRAIAGKFAERAEAAEEARRRLADLSALRGNDVRLSRRAAELRHRRTAKSIWGAVMVSHHRSSARSPTTRVTTDHVIDSWHLGNAIESGVQQPPRCQRTPSVVYLMPRAGGTRAAFTECTQIQQGGPP
jgi:hypothetical protein